MHMMFVDESGDPGYPANGNWTGWNGSRYFVRVGVIIHGWKWKAWHVRMMNFKDARGLLWSDEIKANHLRRGKGAFVGWDQSRRGLFLTDLAKLIGYSREVTVIGVAIDKQKVNLNSSERVIRPDVRSLELLLERYNHFLEHQTDKTGIVILDPVEESKDDNLRYFQNYLVDQGRNFQQGHIVEGTFFAKSHTSNLLQVADFVANTIYHHVSRPGPQVEFDQIQPRLWRWNNRIKGYGLKVWPE
jgi:hypothetical protein